jgi:hypothetical protein
MPCAKWITSVVAAALPLIGLPAMAFETMNWAPRNAAILTRFIHDHGHVASNKLTGPQPYAVFDWDQTSAFLDCGEATLHYQLENLRFKLTPDQFRALLKPEINGVKRLSAESGGMVLADLNTDLLSAYRFLYDHHIGPGGKMSLAEIRQTPQFQDFITKLPVLYDGYCDTAGIGAPYGYPWVTFLLANFTILEVKSIAKSAIEAGLGDGLHKITWHGPKPFQSICGPVSYRFRSGLRVHPEMQSLMHQLRAAGIDVYVISASLKPIVEVFSGPGNFGYNVPADHVLAMETELKQGHLQPVYKAGWVQTQRAGKVAAIKQVLGKRGDPIFGAGDSDGDVEMLSDFPGMKLALILNRVRGGDIGTLAQKAAAQMAEANPRFILQGRNENTGLFIPSAETISLGQTALQLLKKP